MRKMKVVEWTKNISAYAGILFFIIMAFEVMIMISPFAFFFYSVFNPLFKWLGHYASTGWLTAFFLPHMILPPTLLLKTIRIAGSFFFITGALAFLVCASQVYFNKIFRRGAAVKGLYAYIRHPQYMALGMWGTGMAILWPRFIVLASLSLMFVLYYFLAKDEELRMLGQYGSAYELYLKSTGMFFPRFIEKYFVYSGITTPVKHLITASALITITMVAGLFLRQITLYQLPFESKNNITLIAILPEDNKYYGNVIAGVSDWIKKGKESFFDDKKDYLGYLMTPDYVMQGMIADTGSDFHLYKKHHTVAMISDWVLHPFAHLRRSPSEHMAKMHNVNPLMARRHHCPIGVNQDKLDCNACPFRRVIFVGANNNGRHLSGKELLSFNIVRKPAGFIDINVRTGEIVNMKKVGMASAWQDVPTPAI